MQDQANDAVIAYESATQSSLYRVNDEVVAVISSLSEVAQYSRTLFEDMVILEAHLRRRLR